MENVNGDNISYESDVYVLVHVYYAKPTKLQYTMYESIYVSIRTHTPNAIRGMGMRNSATKAMKRKQDDDDDDDRKPNAP